MMLSARRGNYALTIDPSSKTRRRLTSAFLLAAIAAVAVWVPAPFSAVAAAIPALSLGFGLGVLYHAVEQQRGADDEKLHKQLHVARLWKDRDPKRFQELEEELERRHARRRWRPFTV